MTQDELNYAESEQRQHHERMLHQSLLGAAIEAQEYNLVKLLNPTIRREGNQWMVYYGENFALDGIAGFGDTPYLAVLDFNRQWNTRLINTPSR